MIARFKKLLGLSGQLISTMSRKIGARVDDHPTLILMYHRISDQPEDPHLLCVHPKLFREQMAFLRDQFSPVSLGSWKQSSRPNPVVVTFDDGYADNLYQALPVLEEFKIPFSVFVCTGPVEKQIEFPTDRWDRLLDALIVSKNSATLLPPSVPGGASNLAKRRAALHRWFYRLTPAQREELLGPLEETFSFSGTPRESHRAMTIAEVQRLAQHPLASIGSHTEDHPCLASLNFDEQQLEIRMAQTKLAQWLRRPVETMAYPYGQASDYNDDSSKICVRENITIAVTTRFGQAWENLDPWQLPRFPVRNWSIAQFKRRLGIFRWL